MLSLDRGAVPRSGACGWTPADLAASLEALLRLEPPIPTRPWAGGMTAGLENPLGSQAIAFTSDQRGTSTTPAASTSAEIADRP